jgi:hypothetical protein
MECELRLVREEAQRQERNVLNLTDAVNSKDTEVWKDGGRNGNRQREREREREEFSESEKDRKF